MLFTPRPMTRSAITASFVWPCAACAVQASAGALVFVFVLLQVLLSCHDIHQDTMFSQFGRVDICQGPVRLGQSMHPCENRRTRREARGLKFCLHHRSLRCFRRGCLSSYVCGLLYREVIVSLDFCLSGPLALQASQQLEATHRTTSRNVCRDMSTISLYLALSMVYSEILHGSVCRMPTTKQLIADSNGIRQQSASY